MAFVRGAAAMTHRKARSYRWRPTLLALSADGAVSGGESCNLALWVVSAGWIDARHVRLYH